MAVNTVWRIDVLPRIAGNDPHGAVTLERLHSFGLDQVAACRSSRIFLVEGSVDRPAVESAAATLLSDPVTERWSLLNQGGALSDPADGIALEVHHRPGVMDPAAASTLAALREMGLDVNSVRTARRYELVGSGLTGDTRSALHRIIANDCVEEVFDGGRPVAAAPVAAIKPFELMTVPIGGMDDRALTQLSRQGHLFLTLDEMQAVQAHFHEIGRDPTDLELETFAQTWSEHCVHKTLKSAVIYRGAPMPSADGDTPPVNSPVVEIEFQNLLKDTIARATRELAAEQRGPECLSVFVDNAGIIAFDDEYGVAFKVETHNRPSAIEPYGGAATGIGGCIRDVLGCGLAAKPIANTDVFCVAPPDWPIDAVPQGVLHPRTVLHGITAGVRDYGNRMGIPTVNGAVHFDPRYLGNPLVFAGCVGLIPRDKVEKRSLPGDRIVVLGGRTGRDGIHGATFSSAELTDTHTDEFSHAVQIGNAIEEKKVLDLVLAARDHASGCLFNAITDCGAGGLSSAVGEMTAELGGEVELSHVPLKYAGLRYDEIWISESQERMVMAVPPERLDTLMKLCADEEVEATDIGAFNDSGRLTVKFNGTLVGAFDLAFLHEGYPRQRRLAEWLPPDRSQVQSATPRTASLTDQLCEQLSRPTVASKRWLIRQYDHEVQGRSAIKPLVGPLHAGPSDAAVVRPRLESRRGVAVGCGLCPERADVDPYWMAAAAVDEALRNVVAVGGDPARTAILDNFSWGRTDIAANMGSLVRACQACYDAAKVYGVPFISGKDSLNNEFALHADDRAALMTQIDSFRARYPMPGEVLRDGRLVIPATLLISAISVVEDVSRCVSMDFKQPGGRVYLVGGDALIPRAAGSGSGAIPGPTRDPVHGVIAFPMPKAAAMLAQVSQWIGDGAVMAAHDVSDGGVMTALAEMSLASDRGCRVEMGALDWSADDWFSYLPGAMVIEATAGCEAQIEALADRMPVTCIGIIAGEHAIGSGGGATFEIASLQGVVETIAVAMLRERFERPLDW